MDGRERLRVLVQQAEQLVRRHSGREISLHDPTVVAARKRSLVVRCTVAGWDGVTSVVLKRNEGDDERGFTDWASLAFLSTLEEATGIAPHFYAGDARERFFVMEDLGGSRSLEDLLDNGDAATMVEALGSLATSMARLVMATSGRVAALAPLAELGGHMSEALRARWPELGDGALHWPGVVGAP